MSSLLWLRLFIAAVAVVSFRNVAFGQFFPTGGRIAPSPRAAAFFGLFSKLGGLAVQPPLIEDV